MPSASTTAETHGRIALDGGEIALAQQRGEVAEQAALELLRALGEEAAGEVGGVLARQGRQLGGEEREILRRQGDPGGPLLRPAARAIERLAADVGGEEAQAVEPQLAGGADGGAQLAEVAALHGAAAGDGDRRERRRAGRRRRRRASRRRAAGCGCGRGPRGGPSRLTTTSSQTRASGTASRSSSRPVVSRVMPMPGARGGGRRAPRGASAAAPRRPRGPRARPPARASPAASARRRRRVSSSRRPSRQMSHIRQRQLQRLCGIEDQDGEPRHGIGLRQQRSVRRRGRRRQGPRGQHGHRRTSSSR